MNMEFSIFLLVIKKEKGYLCEEERECLYI